MTAFDSPGSLEDEFLIVKICGITSLEDADLSLRGGATALGFNFYPPSPRYIEPDSAAAIVRSLSASFLKVAVVVHGQGEFPSRLTPLFDVVQVHRVADERDLAGYSLPVWVAVSPKRLGEFPDYEVVVDPSWGRGRRADWRSLASAGRSFILAGGLTPENVQEAIELTRPRGVDVCSGVESVPGRKDPRLLKAFLNAVTSAGSASKGSQV